MEDRKNTIPSQGTELNDEELDRVTGGAHPGVSCHVCGEASTDGSRINNQATGGSSTRDSPMTCSWCGKSFASLLVTGQNYCSYDCLETLTEQAESLRPKFEL